MWCCKGQEAQGILALQAPPSKGSCHPPMDGCCPGVGLRHDDAQCICIRNIVCNVCGWVSGHHALLSAGCTCGHGQSEEPQMHKYQRLAKVRGDAWSTAFAPDVDLLQRACLNDECMETRSKTKEHACCPRQTGSSSLKISLHAFRVLVNLLQLMPAVKAQQMRIFNEARTRTAHITMHNYLAITACQPSAAILTIPFEA